MNKFTKQIKQEEVETLQIAQAFIVKFAGAHLEPIPFQEALKQVVEELGLSSRHYWLETRLVSTKRIIISKSLLTNSQTFATVAHTDESLEELTARHEAWLSPILQPYKEREKQKAQNYAKLEKIKAQAKEAAKADPQLLTLRQERILTAEKLLASINAQEILEINQEKALQVIYQSSSLKEKAEFLKEKASAMWSFTYYSLLNKSIADLEPKIQNTIRSQILGYESRNSRLGTPLRNEAEALEKELQQQINNNPEITQRQELIKKEQETADKLRKQISELEEQITLRIRYAEHELTIKLKGKALQNGELLEL